jgi:glucose/arabinose dehydrogenase
MLDRRRAFWIGLALTAAACSRMHGSVNDPSARGVSALGGGPYVPGMGPSHRFRPKRVDANDAAIGRLRVPDGFALSVFARGVGHPRMLAVSDAGIVYATRERSGDVVMLLDPDKDGRVDAVRTVASGLPEVNGIALRDGRVYVATPTRIAVADVLADGSFGPMRVFVDGFPVAGRHPNRTLGFGPDGALYVSIGSSCNACVEHNREHASILRVQPDGSAREVFARGLRNTIGFDWHPSTHAMWGMDQGVDERGDDAPPEELNLLEAGGDYGWPWCFGDQATDPISARELPGPRANCRETRSFVIGTTAHSAPMAFVFVRGRAFPAEYRGDALVAFHGSWNRIPASGFDVRRVRFRDGRPFAFEPFLTGFLAPSGATQFGRPVGLAFTSDGALLVSDDENGVIYRVTYGPG